jgi:Rrf2 family iron-sulfur cluster assembly transcriptional regulator
VITAVDEKVDTTRCGGLSNCQDDERCLTHDLWVDLSEQIYNFLSNISLGQLMDRKGVREVAVRQDMKSSNGQQSVNLERGVRAGGSGF